MTISRIFLTVIILVGISALCLGEDDPPFLLRVESLDRREILFDLPVKKGDRFYIDYIHSSDKTPVQDIFEIGERGEMILIEENFYWYGAGLEFMNWEKASMTIEDGMIKVRLRRHLPSFRLRVGRVANHTFKFEGVIVPLNKIAGGGELLKIWVTPVGP